MFVISDNVSNEIEIKKSKFICLLYKIDDISLVNECLNDVKNMYKNATHYCYAYNINGHMKFSDDNEPSGTAGAPMLDIIKLKDLTNILVIVVRYFGGIKLGSGGLIRAYRSSLVEALNKTNIIPYKKYIVKNIVLPLDKANKLNILEKKYKLLNKEYTDKITASFEIDENDMLNLESLLNN